MERLVVECPLTSPGMRLCSGCGACCMSGPCLAALWHYGKHGYVFGQRCLGMYFERGRYWCYHNVTRTTFKLLGLISPDPFCIAQWYPKEASMSEFYTEVVKLGSIEKHPNADTLGITNVMGGYPCIVRLGEFQEGDLAVYLSVDAMVNTTQERFAFLASKAHADGFHRIKALRLRGAFSMGLLCRPDAGMQCGDNVAEVWGVRKYEPPLSGCPEGEDVAGPGGIPKYDIEGLRRFKDALMPGETVWISEKIHGANARFMWYEGRLHIGSHGKWKAPGGADIWNRAAATYKLEEKLQAMPGLLLYGEVYGPVQDMRYGVPKGSGEVRLAFFDALRKGSLTFLSYDELHQLLFTLDLPPVPLLFHGPWQPSLVSLAEGPSTVPGAAHVREGIVIKPVIERTVPVLGRVVLKLHGEGYLTRK